MMIHPNGVVLSHDVTSVNLPLSLDIENLEWAVEFGGPRDYCRQPQCISGQEYRQAPWRVLAPVLIIRWDGFPYV